MGIYKLATRDLQILRTAWLRAFTTPSLASFASSAKFTMVDIADSLEAANRQIETRPLLLVPLSLSPISHGCESQCFGGHCGSLGHGGSGSWVTVWWWIRFGGG
ncbi:hypothetical protein CMV_000300 [Castanea mollissima]|uniref:Uncharacterized protein n=1 Tax=Castanea mollissima TaxID=60419 RepID=A0A8J4W7K1_9ROSI|nr:hypothetical protein CMV_000300 [Castanea mollissima]